MKRQFPLANVAFLAQLGWFPIVSLLSDFPQTANALTFSHDE
jgi:hypothetical protein